VALLLTQNNHLHYAKITLPSAFVTSNLHLGLLNYRTNREISRFSILINFEALHFTSLSIPGFFLLFHRAF